MAKGITGKEPDPREVYGDIIDHPHWESPKHPPMSLYDRAAQFAPFAALSGYDDMIGEEARLVDNRIELSEEEWEELNRKLGRIDETIRQGAQPAATITYFVPDPLKPGGLYETIAEKADPTWKSRSGTSWTSSRKKNKKVLFHRGNRQANRDTDPGFFHRLLIHVDNHKARKIKACGHFRKRDFDRIRH